MGASPSFQWHENSFAWAGSLFPLATVVPYPKDQHILSDYDFLCSHNSKTAHPLTLGLFKHPYIPDLSSDWTFHLKSYSTKCSVYYMAFPPPTQIHFTPTVPFNYERVGGTINQFPMWSQHLLINYSGFQPIWSGHTQDVNSFMLFVTIVPPVATLTMHIKVTLRVFWRISERNSSQNVCVHFCVSGFSPLSVVHLQYIVILSGVPTWNVQL